MGAAQGGLRDRVILAIREQGLDHNGFHPHGWRCEHPDRFPGYCDCVASMADAVIAVMTKPADPSPSATETAPDQAGSTGTGNQTDGGR